MLSGFIRASLLLIAAENSASEVVANLNNTLDFLLYYDIIKVR